MDMEEFVLKLFPVGDEDVERSRDFYGKTEGDVKRDVEDVKCWMRGQGKLSQNYDDGRIERFLLRNKFRLDKTKQKITSYYTLRTKHADFFKDIDPKSKTMQEIRKSMIWAPLPVLTPKSERIFVFCFNPVKANIYNIEHACLYIMSILDIQLSYDYAVGDRFIIDLENMTFAHFRNLKIFNLLKLLELYMEGSSGRVTGLDIINPPSFLKLLLLLMRIVLPTKLASRICVHKDTNDLFKEIPKKCVPKIYGGELNLDLHNIHCDMGKMVLSLRDFILEKSSQL